MKVVRNAQVCEQNLGAYESPEVKVMAVESEGVLCSSGTTEKFEDGYFDWN